MNPPVNPEHFGALTALFLNKVRGLDWYYFELDLNDFGTDYKKRSVAPTSDFMNEIVLENGEYSFKNLQNLPKDKEIEILGHLLNFMKNHGGVAREIIRRIFDSNDPQILNKTDADEGMLGRLNEKNRKRRNKKFIKKMKQGFRRKEGNITIMAEGDSWFEFPRIFWWESVHDIVDCLIKRDNCAVYSVAAGGDWLSNMIYTGEYIEELPKITPDVFLFSGGGNDLLGGYRLASMVRSFWMEGPRPKDDPLLQKLLARRKGPNTHSLDEDLYVRGISWLNDEFFNFINMAVVQYFLMVQELSQLERYSKMLFITQGYDFAIPSSSRRGFFDQRLINWFTNSGKWLFEPLNLKGITDPKDQYAIVYAMIQEFNEMLIQLAVYDGFPNLFHIDCRGVGEQQSYWFDEIHLKSRHFKKIGDVFYQCMNENFRLRRKGLSRQDKVYKVLESSSYSNQI